MNTYRQTVDKRRKKAIKIYTERKGDITMDELGKLLGVTAFCVNNYITTYFKAIRGNKF